MATIELVSAELLDNEKLQQVVSFLPRNSQVRSNSAFQMTLAQRYFPEIYQLSEWIGTLGLGVQGNNVTLLNIQPIGYNSIPLSHTRPIAIVPIDPVSFRSSSGLVVLAGPGALVKTSPASPASETKAVDSLDAQGARLLLIY